MKRNAWQIVVRRFWMQPTESFPDGPPQREDYFSDDDHDLACHTYEDEWVCTYECCGCDNLDCPECGARLTK